VLEIVNTLIEAFHLMAVNIASGGPLICVWLHFRASRRDDPTADFVGRRLAKASLTMLLVGGALGVVNLMITMASGDESYVAVLKQFPARRYYFAIAELVFSLVLAGAYLALWDKMKRVTWVHGLLAVVNATNLLYHFPLLLTMISVVSTRGDLAGQTIDLAAYRQLLLDPEVVSRSVHVVLASFAMAGIYVMAFGLTLAKHETLSDQAPRVARWGASIALVPTLFQMGVGTWVLMTLPIVARKGLMGGDPIATGLFMASLLATFALLHLLGAVAFGKCDRKKIVRSMVVMTVIIVLMTGTIRRVRHLATPREIKSPSTLDEKNAKRHGPRPLFALNHRQEEGRVERLEP